MPATKPRPTARIWLIVALIGAGAALLIYIYNSRRGAEDRLFGEWSMFASRGKQDDAEILWTFRPDGIFRIDMVDRRTRKQIRAMVGQWRVEDGEVVLVEEVWSDKTRRPMQTVERLRVQSVGESELVLRPVERNGHPAGAEEDLQFRRSGMSGRELGDEG